MHLKPPLVEPAHEPMNMQKPSTTHVKCGHWPASSVNIPVVVMKVMTWNRACLTASLAPYPLRLTRK